MPCGPLAGRCPQDPCGGLAMRERWVSWPIYQRQIWPAAFWISVAVIVGALVGAVAWKLFGE